jgi:hypothetical protein
MMLAGRSSTDGAVIFAVTTPPSDEISTKSAVGSGICGLATASPGGAAGADDNRSGLPARYDVEAADQGILLTVPRFPPFPDGRVGTGWPAGGLPRYFAGSALVSAPGGMEILKRCRRA